MEKTPCIKCTPELWEYIEPYLREWGYHIFISNAWDSVPLLVINDGARFGTCNNYDIGHVSSFNRELVTDVEEFLERAAKLKGKTYKRKDIMKINGIEIKPGMIIEIQEDNKEKITYVVFPLLNGELGVISYNRNSWDDIKNFIKYYSSKIIYIRDLTSSKRGGLNDGKILWEKPKEIVITMDEIAKKFGYPIEQIKIKK